MLVINAVVSPVFHKYPLPPEASRVTPSFSQITVSPVITISGISLTVTGNEAETPLPQSLIP